MKIKNMEIKINSVEFVITSLFRILCYCVFLTSQLCNNFVSKYQ